MNVNFRKQDFIELWNKGVSNNEIQKILGISNYTLYRVVKDLNLPEKKRGRPSLKNKLVD